MNTFTDLLFAQTPQRALRLDLRIPPATGPVPLVIYIPMGGMRECRKEWAPTWLVEYGFALASIEARVSREAIAPAAMDDCQAAVRWLRAHAGDYGYSPRALGVWGHSAGGLLAALLGTSGKGDSAVQAVCDECGAPHDFACFARPEVKQRFPGVVENLRLYLGGLVEDRLDLARLVSPQTYVSSACPPMLLIHGDADDVVPVEETIQFHQSLRTAGVDATLRILSGIGHGWDASLTRDAIVAFFERTLRPLA